MATKHIVKKEGKKTDLLLLKQQTTSSESCCKEKGWYTCLLISILRKSQNEKSSFVLCQKMVKSVQERWLCINSMFFLTAFHMTNTVKLQGC